MGYEVYTIFFWLSLIYISYVEIGYLAILWLVSRIYVTKRQSGEITPTVTIYIAAYNEEKVIREKIINTLEMDYPREKIQVLVTSDCSTDRTDEIVQEFSSDGVVLVRSCPRLGKIVALRNAESHITGELVLFTDADAILSSNAIKALVRRFVDPKVGAVTGREVRQPITSTGKGVGEGIYNRIDTKIKTLEGLIGNQVVVHGGIFMIRRSLLPYVPDHLTHDSIVPLQLSLTGYKTLYEPDALSYEAYNLDTSQDWHRRIRTILQAMQSYLYKKEALNPIKSGFYAFKIWSHRFSRWFILPAMIIALLSNFLWLAIPFFIKYFY